MNSEINLTISKEELQKIKPMIQDLQDVTNATSIKEGKFSVEFIEEKP